MARVYVTANIRVNLIPRCIINMPKVSQRVLIQIMDYAVEKEKGFAPVRTGALRDSIRRYVIGTNGGVVRAGGGSDRNGNPIDYAPYQEYGTVYNAPHPFVRPTAAIALDAVNQIGNIEAELLS
jgi:HK97 gp10 family phage protein